jgi:hypothetical protein
LGHGFIQFHLELLRQGPCGVELERPGAFNSSRTQTAIRSNLPKPIQDDVHSIWSKRVQVTWLQNRKIIKTALANFSILPRTDIFPYSGKIKSPNYFLL